MSLLTRIVKHGSVVEDRPESPQFSPVIPGHMKTSGVIKRQLLSGQPQPGLHAPAFPSKDMYTDELNRLRVEIKQAKDELRELNLQLEAAEDTLLNPPSRLQDATGITVDEAEAEALGILEEANTRAAEILQNARDEGAALIEQSKNDGYLEGFARGTEEAQEEFHREYGGKMVLIAEILDRLSDYEAELLGNRERDLIELSFAVAKKVIGKSLESDPAIVADMLRSLVTENSREEFVKITLSPDLVPIQAKASAKVRSLLTELGANVTLLTSHDSAPGEIIVETPKGVVDISIETQLNNLKTAVLTE